MVQQVKYQKTLIIDDDETDIFITKRILESVCFAKELVTHATADAAMEYLEKLVEATAQLPEIIFLDLNLPGKSGFDLLEDLRKLGEKTKADFRIVILSNVIGEHGPELIGARNYSIVKAVLEKPLNKLILKGI